MRYQLDGGRTIVRDGVAIAYVSRIGSDSTGYALAPSEVDDLAHAIVAALNETNYPDTRVESRAHAGLDPWVTP